MEDGAGCNRVGGGGFKRYFPTFRLIIKEAGGNVLVYGLFPQLGVQYCIYVIARGTDATIHTYRAAGFSTGSARVQHGFSTGSARVQHGFSTGLLPALSRSSVLLQFVVSVRTEKPKD